MKKFWIQLFVLLIVIFGAIYLSYNEGIVNLEGESTGLGQNEEIVGNDDILTIIDGLSAPGAEQTKAQVNIEIANTNEKRSLGLGQRDLLASDSGMLFEFDKAFKPTFWMKGMRFPLDFIWIRDGRIVAIHRNVPHQPEGTPDNEFPRYAPDTEADSMLEVNAGFSQSKNIQVGDKILQ